MTDDALSERAPGSGEAPLPPFFAERDEPPRPASPSPAPPFFADAAAPASPEAEPRAAPEGDDESFPDDIFFVPEGAAAPVSGGVRMAEQAGGESSPEEDPAADALAGRLEELAARLRAEGRGALIDRLDSDDRVEALVAAVLAGYLAGHG